jgi:transporter family protein
MSTSWLTWALLSAVFAALTSIFAKAGLEGLHPDLATVLRTTVILCVVSGVMVATGSWTNPWQLPSKTLFLLTASGLATAASWICYFRALQLGEASKVDPVDKLSLLLVAVFAFLFLKERPTGLEWLGIVMVGAGIVLLALKK